jgi:putative ABC transport system permease protein
MLKNYFLINLRNFLRNWSYSLINLLGLTIGLTAVIVILIYVFHEFSYDRFHRQPENVYRIVTDINMAGNDQTFALAQTPLAPEVTRRYPEIISYTRIHRSWNSILITREEQQFYEKKILYADSGFFKTFDFKVLQGDPDELLSRPYTMVLTKSMAQKYFGKNDPIGKTLSINNRKDYEITGILEDPPSNSHFSFDGILSFSTFYEGSRAKWMDSWVGNINYFSYIRVMPGTSPGIIEKKLNETVLEKAGQAFEDYGFSLYARPQALTDIHLRSDYEHDIQPHGNITNVYIFIIIAFVILVIAAINFMNLSTARSANRAREVGIRKVNGAKRRMLIFQFLSESVIYSLIAFLLALALSHYLLPQFSGLMNRELSFSFVENPSQLMLFLGVSIMIGILAGLYPAFYLSNFRAVRVLKGEMTRGKAGATFRNILVVVQFSISVILIIGTIIVYQQISYINNKDLGFDHNRVLIVALRNNDLTRDIKSVKERLEKIPGVIATAGSQNYFGNEFSGNAYRFKGMAPNENILMNFTDVDSDFVNLYEMKIKEGRNFSEEHGTEEEKVLMNEVAVLHSGLENPIGEFVWGADSAKKEIIGVIENFHFGSLHKSIEPLIVTSRSSNLNYLSIKIENQNIKETINKLQLEWEAIDPDRPFDYFFLNDTFADLYNEEKRLGNMYFAFSLLAILIALLGLFGLSSFITEQRTKEISIRKVLGASSKRIVVKLSSNFMLLVLIANLVAWPAAWYLMKNWLENFAYRVDINPLAFVAAGILSVLISFLTVSIQAYRASIANPADQLRHE